MPQYQRPIVPYVPPAVLRFSSRFDTTADNNQSPSGIQLDSEINYLIDSLNALYAVAISIGAGILPGATSPTNVNKFPVTDGVNPATISWTKVTSDYLADDSITTESLQAGSVTEEVIDDGAVTNEKIRADAIQNNNISDDSISFDKITVEDNIHFTDFFNAQEDGSLSGSKLSDDSVPPRAIADNSLPGTKLTNNTLPATKIVQNSITNAQLAPIVQIPIGGMIDWTVPGNVNPPAGWIKAIGQTLSRTTYAALFAAYGVYYGAGDGATTFGIPDTRGRVMVGVDNGAAQPTAGRVIGNAPLQSGSAGGEETHVLTINEMPSHHHSYTGTTSGGLAQGGNVAGFTAQNTGDTGGDQAHNNMQPYMLMPKIIYAGV